MDRKNILVVDNQGRHMVADHVLFEKPYDILILITVIEDLLKEKILFE